VRNRLFTPHKKLRLWGGEEEIARQTQQEIRPAKLSVSRTSMVGCTTGWRGVLKLGRSLPNQRNILPGTCLVHCRSLGPWNVAQGWLSGPELGGATAARLRTAGFRPLAASRYGSH